jgi:diaminohydroxyphosphoribosylaminopyrimidine deaminase/5-amino-6-(5-phosphoribosylamino)uracil reductase
MRAALRLARRGAGTVSPNPLVGAILVREGKIVGSGYHRFFGGPHAERYALEIAGEKARGADLYINLEPCSHFGKTPPCSDALIAAGIRRAFIGMQDPNALVSGSGIKKLAAAGIAVETGILERECRQLNEAFVKYITSRFPFVCLKLAASLDGKIATSSGDSTWITGAASRALVHSLRSRVDAVMVGIGTVLSDDPQLTARLHPGANKNPLRVIVDSTLRTPLRSRLLATARNVPTIIATTANSPKSRAAAVTQSGAELLTMPARNGRVNLKLLMKKLGQRGIASVLIEGGSELSAAALQDGIVDKVLFFYAPKIIGGINAYPMVGGAGSKKLSRAITIKDIRYRKVGDDILVEGYIAK